MSWKNQRYLDAPVTWRDVEKRKLFKSDNTFSESFNEPGQLLKVMNLRQYYALFICWYFNTLTISIAVVHIKIWYVAPSIAA
jgi:hypothetical protein